MTITQAALPATLRLGPVHLNVADLDRSIAWYARSLGLATRSRAAGEAELGDTVATSVVLHEEPDAEVQGDDRAGLFHYCLLYSTREELARAALRIQATGTEVRDMSDRHTHEAIYLDDPDGNTIELAWDRPRDEWPEKPYGHAPVPLDVDDLLAVIEGEEMTERVEDGLSVGHVHLVVGDTERLIEFYRDVLGFDLKYRVDVGAFFSVAGYHHHTAGNVRRGEVGNQPEGAIGLRHWTIELGDAEEVRAVRERLVAAGYLVEVVEEGIATSDPWRIPLHVLS
jgi:catechol 2,3-dioxygenase